MPCCLRHACLFLPPRACVSMCSSGFGVRRHGRRSVSQRAELTLSLTVRAGACKLTLEEVLQPSAELAGGGSTLAAWLRAPPARSSAPPGTSAAVSLSPIGEPVFLHLRCTPSGWGVTHSSSSSIQVLVRPILGVAPESPHCHARVAFS